MSQEKELTVPQIKVSTFAPTTDEQPDIADDEQPLTAEPAVPPTENAEQSQAGNNETKAATVDEVGIADEEKTAVNCTEDSELVIDDQQTTEPPKIEASEPDNEFLPLEIGSLQLLNATTNKPYQCQIELSDLKIGASALRPTLTRELKEIGLAAEQTDAQTLRITGTPLLAGEHSFNFDYLSDENRVYRKKLKLLVNPDPKSLWKTVEPPADALHPKPHQQIERLSGQEFTIAAASVRGRSHAHQGTFREDDFVVKILENGWHILVVADGAGSARLSRRGSWLACQTAAETLALQIDERLAPKFVEFITKDDWKNDQELRDALYHVLCGAAFAAHKQLEQESEQTQNALKDFATTLLLAIVKKSGDKTFIASFGVGDGAIAVYDEQNTLVKLLNKPDGGEFSGQTRFLTMPEIVSSNVVMMQRVEYQIFDSLTALFLMTDGISDPNFATDKNLESPEKWSEFTQSLAAHFAFDRDDPEIAQKLLAYMDFWAPGEHDDRTLAILF